MWDGHQYEGKRAVALDTSEIYEMLDGGIALSAPPDVPCDDPIYWGRLRLEVELVRRRLALPILDRTRP